MLDGHLCPVCGEISTYECRGCLQRYKDDLSVGHIPPQFLRAPDVEFSFTDWLEVKTMEKMCDQERRSERDTRTCITATCDKLIRMHREEKVGRQECQRRYVAQQKKKVDDEIRRRSTY